MLNFAHSFHANTITTKKRALKCSPSQRQSCNQIRSRNRIRMTSNDTLFASGVEKLEHEGAYAVLAAANELEARTGKPVVHLEIGQPGFSTPSHIVNAGIEAIKNGETKYSSPAGIAELREKVVDLVSKTRNVSVNVTNVVIGPGAKPGLFFATLALVRGPNDQVIIPDPGFPTYKAMVQVANGTCVPVRLNEDGSSFDMNELRNCVGPNTRLLVLNSPGNPTGGVIPKHDLVEIARLANLHDFWVITDEIYSELVYADTYHSIISEGGMLERTVLIDGFSKSYCMTGWRLGWAVMPEKLAERVELLATHVVGCTATFTQFAGVAALQGDTKQVRVMRDTYRRRRDLVVNAMNQIEGVKCAQPEGAFYAFVDISNLGVDCKTVANRLLNEGLVAVLPGTDFGDGGEGYIRISYVAEDDVLEEGMRRITDVLQRISAERKAIV